MLGVVFTEFLEMVEDAYSFDMVDDIIAQSGVASGGAYTAVGTYDPGEMLALVAALSDRTGVPVGDLVRGFGRHLFPKLANGHGEIVEGLSTSLDLLERIENRIHVEVRKLYPDANLPRFACTREGPDRLVMEYASVRPLAPLAIGLIEGCAEHFGETLVVKTEDLSGGVGNHARFTITRTAAA